MTMFNRKRMLWRLLKFYGEVRWFFHGGACPGYYWALRGCCNWCGMDWYGRPCGKVFHEVGRIRW